MWRSRRDRRVFTAIGVMFGLIEVGVVALAREAGRPGVAGVMLGLWALGSLVSGLFYGTRQWRTSAVGRFQIGVGAMTVGCVLIAAAGHSLAVTTTALMVAGLANAPTLIAGNTLVPSVVPAQTVTEAYTWLGVAVFAGIALGSPIAGVLIDQTGAASALGAGGIAGAVATTMAITGRRMLRRGPTTTTRAIR